MFQQSSCQIKQLYTVHERSQDQTSIEMYHFGP